MPLPVGTWSAPVGAPVPYKEEALVIDPGR
jgi:hypothetical protein